MPSGNNTAIVPDPIVDGDTVVFYDETTDMVFMPLWYWKKVCRFIIDAQENMKK